MSENQSTQNTSSSTDKTAADLSSIDAVVIGAGFGGMYALHSLRESGLSVRVFDAAAGIGGTWWWNRYPGARVDFPGGPFYCYTFSEQLIQEWDWAETQPDQSSVLAYLNHVADKFDLRRNIQLNTHVESAVFDSTSQRWTIQTNQSETVSAQYLICALGTLSAANRPEIPGMETFTGQCYHTGQWPSDPVDFTGKRVGIIGTGSSGIQAIPLIAEAADQLTVFQRTPQFTIPSGNQPIDPALVQEARQDWPAMRQRMMKSPLGAPYTVSSLSAKDHTAEQRQAKYEQQWRKGSLGILFETYHDVLTNKESNAELAEFIRCKIRETVHDPLVAEKLLPNYHLGTKRQVLDNDYYATYNRDNVNLIDLRTNPILSINPTSISTKNSTTDSLDQHPLDMLILATGYDAITGAIQRLDPKGLDGISLSAQWSERFSTYLGMTIPNFPNLFMIHGPESPSVLFNMPLGAELQSDWIRDCIQHLKDNHQNTITASADAATAWSKEVENIASQTLYADTESWYTGANIPGKHRQFAVYLGGPAYYSKLADIAANDYPGFGLQPTDLK
ncbi:MAG: NAD(P)/FAD-dependent oxidoreductase [Pseudomonadales bacterium]|nr:NAD(P)/FAD-dependent oxidoreductase [Pseudomonadales bacterium]